MARQLSEVSGGVLSDKRLPLTFYLLTRLFYTMLDLSEDWQRNKWWLFDRVVESPHRTSFFVRRYEAKATDKESSDMQEAAQYWCVASLSQFVRSASDFAIGTTDVRQARPRHSLRHWKRHVRLSRRLSTQKCASENGTPSNGRERAAKIIAVIQPMNLSSGVQTSRLPTAMKAPRRALARTQIN